MMCTWRNRQSIQVLHIIMSGKKKEKIFDPSCGGRGRTGEPAAPVKREYLHTHAQWQQIL